MKNYIITGILVAAAGFIGYVLGKRSFKRHPEIVMEASDTHELRLGGYKYINPLLELDNSRESNIVTRKELENNIQHYIDSAIAAENTVSNISYYYRDLNNGQWVGINENEIFSPASLLKVPIMIAVYKKAENDASFLKKKIKYEHVLDAGLKANIGDSTIQTGNIYTIDELVYKMIIHSDNEARLLLLQNIEQPFLTTVFTDIGIDMSSFDDSKDFMSVKTYSNFFRLLYNATYLNRTYSEKALQILALTNFDNGLAAGLPAGTVLANKFGERGYVDTNIRQLHDCGIVYKDNAPYLICVMTRGVDIDAQTKIIADISKITYQHH